MKRIKQSAEKQQQYQCSIAKAAEPIHTLIVLYVRLYFIDFCFHSLLLTNEEEEEEKTHETSTPNAFNSFLVHNAFKTEYWMKLWMIVKVDGIGI